MNGFLRYDSLNGRFVVEKHSGSVEESRDLRCGDCLTLRVKNGDWRETRIEVDGDDPIYGWYFVGVGRAASFVGHGVEID